MELTKAIELIKPAANRFKKKESWADLGCGNGLFTTALADLLHQGSVVYAVDKDKKALENIGTMKDVNLQKLVADFSRDALPFSGLDGILMANSLHFVRDKLSFINKCCGWLKNKGYFLLIEYDTDNSNPWVPYPISFPSAAMLFQQAGFKIINKLGSQPSLYNRANIYAALIER